MACGEGAPPLDVPSPVESHRAQPPSVAEPKAKMGPTGSTLTPLSGGSRQIRSRSSHSDHSSEMRMEWRYMMEI